MIKVFLELSADYYDPSEEDLRNLQEKLNAFLKDPTVHTAILAPGVQVKIFDLPEEADVPISIEIKPLSPLSQEEYIAKRNLTGTSY